MGKGVGIDIGNDFVKVVQVRTSGLSVGVLRAVKLPRPKEASPENPLRLPANLAEELKRAGIPRMGTVGLSGRDVILKYVVTPPCDPVRLRRILDMQAGEKLPGGSSEITYDYRVLNVLAGARGDLVAMSIVVRNEYLKGTLQALKAAGVSASGATPSAMGLMHAFLRSERPKPGETVLLVDVGADATEMVLHRDGELLFARSAPGGGRKFTQAIDKATKLGWERAEAFKLQRAAISEQEGYDTQSEMLVARSLREAAEQVAGTIRSAVMFCRTQTRIANLNFDRLVLTGGGARLKGLAEYLSKKLGDKPVSLLDAAGSMDLRRLDAASARCMEGPGTDMAVPIGLAVMDADTSAMRMDLLPAEILKRRTLLQKTVYAIAAAAILPIALAVSYARAAGQLEDAKECRTRLEAQLKKSKDERKQIAGRVEAGAAAQREVAFLAGQGRYGVALLNLLRFLRNEIPPGMTVQTIGPPQKAGEAGRGTVEVYGAIDRKALPNPEEALQKVVTKLQSRTEHFQQVQVDAAAGLPKPEAGGDPFRFRVALPWPEGTDSFSMDAGGSQDPGALIFPDRGRGP